MKRFNVLDILLSFVIHVAIFAGIGVVAGALMARKEPERIVLVITILGIFGAVMGIIVWVMDFAWGGSSKRSKKTFNKGIEVNNFKDYSTFEANNGFLVIDGVDGRVGYVANMNARVFQMAEGRELSQIESKHTNMPMGGTSGVYFTFKYNGKLTKFYTYLTNGNKSLQNANVTEAIEKADKYVALLNEAVANSNKA